MQLAVIEYARNVANMQGANSTEFDEKAETPLIIFMPEINPSHMGGTMRLGSRQTLFHQYDNEPSIAETIYNNEVGVFERHRHRYEVNPEMVPLLEDAGLRFTGVDDKGQRMEIIEYRRAPIHFFSRLTFTLSLNQGHRVLHHHFRLLSAAGLWQGTAKGFKPIDRQSPRTVVANE